MPNQYQPPSQAYEQSNGDVRERIRALEVLVQSDRQYIREDMMAAWGHHQTTDAKISKVSDQVLALTGDFIEFRAANQRKIDQTHKTFQTATAVVKWGATVAIIALSAMGKINVEAAKGFLKLFAG